MLNSRATGIRPEAALILPARMLTDMRPTDPQTTRPEARHLLIAHVILRYPIWPDGLSHAFPVCMSW
jgi:hypothetical protein